MFIKAIIAKCYNVWAHGTHFDAGGEDMFCSELKASSPSEYLQGIWNTKREIGVGGASTLIFGMCGAFAAFPTTDKHFMGMTGVEITNFHILCACAYQLLMAFVGCAPGLWLTYRTPISKFAHNVVKVCLIINKLLQLGVVILAVSVILTRARHQDDNVQDVRHFIPAGLNPTTFDIRMVKFLGALNFTSVCASLIGGLNESYSHVLTFLRGKAVNKHRGSCLILYLKYGFFWPFMCALSHLALGLFVGIQYGFVIPYEYPVKIAFITASYPMIPVMVGTIQCLLSGIALIRFCEMRSNMQAQRRLGKQDPETVVFPLWLYNDRAYLALTTVSWIVTILGHAAVQTSWSQEANNTGEGATYAAAMAGILIMPLWTDSMAISAPGRVDRRQWALPEDTTCQDGFVHWLLGLKEGRAPTDPKLAILHVMEETHLVEKGASPSTSSTDDDEDDFSDEEPDLEALYIDNSYLDDESNSDVEGAEAFESERCIV